MHPGFKKIMLVMLEMIMMIMMMIMMMMKLDCWRGTCWSKWCWLQSGSLDDDDDNADNGGDGDNDDNVDGHILAVTMVVFGHRNTVQKKKSQFWEAMNCNIHIVMDLMIQLPHILHKMGS